MDEPDSVTTLLGDARTFLFVPGSRPDRFMKAANSGADAIILDLEDGVAPKEKVAARAAIEAGMAELEALEVPVVIRINGLDTAYGADDLAWLSRLAPPAAVMLPKVENATQIAHARHALGLPVLATIENAAGYVGLHEIAAAPGVVRLVLGHIDFMADTGLRYDENEIELAPLRFEMNIATRMNRLPAPVDGATVQIADPERLRRDMQRGLRYGFGAKICIHPSQIAVVHDVCAPTDDELQWALTVMRADAAAGGAAIQIEGHFVDLPVVLQARRTVARAGRRA